MLAKILVHAIVLEGWFAPDKWTPAKRGLSLTIYGRKVLRQYPESTSCCCFDIVEPTALVLGTHIRYRCDIADNMPTKMQRRLLVFAILVIAPLIVGIVPVMHLASFADHTGEQSYILLVPAVCAALVYYSQGRIFTDIDERFQVRLLPVILPGIVFILLGYFLEPGGVQRHVASTRSAAGSSPRRERGAGARSCREADHGSRTVLAGTCQTATDATRYTSHRASSRASGGDSKRV